MKINIKKILKFLLIIIFTILILYFGYQEYLQFKYPLYKISNLIRHATLPDNVYIHYEENAIFFKYVRDIYIKDGIINDYQKSYHEKYPEQNLNVLIITENNKIYDISSDTKSISEFNNDMTFDENKKFYHYTSGMYKFYNLIEYHAENDQHEVYKYLGKEIINGKKCHKFSFTTHDNTIYSKTIFYLDTESNLILKIIHYDTPNRKSKYSNI